jgi:hypothetical protein
LTLHVRAVPNCSEDIDTPDEKGTVMIHVTTKKYRVTRGAKQYRKRVAEMAATGDPFWVAALAKQDAEKNAPPQPVALAHGQGAPQPVAKAAEKPAAPQPKEPTRTQFLKSGWALLAFLAIGAALCYYTPLLFAFVWMPIFIVGMFTNAVDYTGTPIKDYRRRK